LGGDGEKMKKCNLCGKAVKDDAKLCIFCGNFILESPEEKGILLDRKNI